MRRIVLKQGSNGAAANCRSREEGTNECLGRGEESESLERLMLKLILFAPE